MRRVLVIDDDAKARVLVTAMLSGSGFETLAAEDGEHGLLLARTEAVDIILLDVEMPGMTGYEVCRRLQQEPQTSGLPVVMLTASADPALNRTAYAAGARACIPKPYRREALVAILEATLAGRKERA